MTRYHQPRLMEAAKPMASWTANSQRSQGQVFTRRWVVDLILDLAGYRPADDLGATVIVEPACGTGAFLVPIVDRLAEACERHGRSMADMGSAVRAFDVVNHNVELARDAVRSRLIELGQPAITATKLSTEWVVHEDFLLGAYELTESTHADFVVGNPPYVRLEDVPTDLSKAYRSECSTMRGRADIYVGFFEKGLSMLSPGGRLAFICADRWMRNRYGERLRALVVSHFAVDTVVAMHDVDAFEDSVSAYPAITVLRNGPQDTVNVIEASAGFDEQDGRTLTRWLTEEPDTAPNEGCFDAARLQQWFTNAAHWPSGHPRALDLIADFENRFEPLEDGRTGTRVGIGIASGCDDIYVVDDAPGVEPCRLLPLLTAQDIATGTPLWSGRFLVNPWDKDRLVALAEYPGLAKYLERNSSRIRARHVSRSQPASWYRTIDRVKPDLRERPKLLIPDIKAAAHPVLERGKFYPHHNLYFIVSDVWDLEVLGGLLLSDITNLFVGAYCVRMRGGTYRFQAQYLRKIRVPSPDNIEIPTATNLARAFRRRDREAATDAALSLYGISRSDLLEATAG